eukprot:749348-Hanusia_phi.AAC.1
MTRTSHPADIKAQLVCEFQQWLCHAGAATGNLSLSNLLVKLVKHIGGPGIFQALNDTNINGGPTSGQARKEDPMA